MTENQKETASTIPRPEDDNQFQTIYKNAKYAKLIDSLKSIPKRTALYELEELANKFNNKMEELAMKDKTDTEIYQELRDYFQTVLKNTAAYKNRKEEEYRSGHRVTQLNKQLIKNPLLEGEKFGYLDVGCSEGKITAALGKEVFKKDPSKIFGCDVRQPESTEGFQFKKLEKNETLGKLPYEDDSMGAVTALMVLHHVKPLDAELEEIARVLAPGGWFIIREHDCVDPDYAMVLDIMHGLYARVFSDPAEMEDFKEHYSNYHDRNFWIDKIEKLNLVQASVQSQWIKDESWRYYYDVFKKVDPKDFEKEKKYWSEKRDREAQWQRQKQNKGGYRNDFTHKTFPLSDEKRTPLYQPHGSVSHSNISSTRNNFQSQRGDAKSHSGNSYARPWSENKGRDSSYDGKRGDRDGYYRGSERNDKNFTSSTSSSSQRSYRQEEDKYSHKERDFDETRKKGIDLKERVGHHSEEPRKFVSITKSTTAQDSNEKQTERGNKYSNEERDLNETRKKGIDLKERVGHHSEEPRKFVSIPKSTTAQDSSEKQTERGNKYSNEERDSNETRKKGIDLKEGVGHHSEEPRKFVSIPKSTSTTTTTSQSSTNNSSDYVRTLVSQEKKAQDDLKAQDSNELIKQREKMKDKYPQEERDFDEKRKGVGLKEEVGKNSEEPRKFVSIPKSTTTTTTTSQSSTVSSSNNDKNAADEKKKNENENENKNESSSESQEYGPQNAPTTNSQTDDNSNKQ